MPGYCPICRCKIESGYINKGSYDPNPDDPIPANTEDPILTQLGLSGNNYKGLMPQRWVHIKELQDYYNNLEIQLSVTPLTNFLTIGNTEPNRRWQIVQLRMSIEKILIKLELTLADYFKYDRYGTDTGLIQIDWTDVDRSEGIPNIPLTIPRRALHIEELRRGIYVLPTLWIETFSKHIIDKDLTIPPTNPSKYDRYIIPIGAIGAWTGRTGHIAEWNGSNWQFTPYATLWCTYIKDEDKFYQSQNTIPRTWLYVPNSDYLEVLNFTFPQVEKSSNLFSALYTDNNWINISEGTTGYWLRVKKWATAEEAPNYPEWYAKVWGNRSILSNQIYQFYSKIDVSVKSTGYLARAESSAGYQLVYGDQIIFTYVRNSIGNRTQITPDLKLSTVGSQISSYAIFGSPAVNTKWVYTVLVVKFRSTIGTIITFPFYYVFKTPGTNNPDNINAAAVFINWINMTRNFYIDADNLLALYGRTITDNNYQIDSIAIRYSNCVSLAYTGSALAELDLQMNTIEFHK